jgi:hypothetical protein
MKVASLLVTFGFFALAIGTVVYWVAVWILADLGAWLVRFPYVSPVADVWMAGTGLVGAIGLVRRRHWGVVSGYLSAGACIFIGITAFHFNIRTGQLLRGDAWQLVETMIPALLLLLGTVALFGLPGHAAAQRTSHPR